MSEWKALARNQQIRWKQTTSTLPPNAREDGVYFIAQNGPMGQCFRTETGPYRYCLPRRFASHNLLASVRCEALRRLHRFGIAWHAATPGAAGAHGDLGPATHLLDSQVQCVNTLLSLESEPRLLLDHLRTVEPDARKIIAIHHPDTHELEGLVAFEWIGAENYLGERVRGKRKRGSKTTSADALVVLERDDGGRTGVLIEWKFTERYDAVKPFKSDKGTDRREIYRLRYEAATTPFIADRPPIDAYFHEPHYQLLRLSLLAEAMREAGEHGVDRMVVLYIAPAMNRALRACVPHALKPFGRTVDAVWRTLLPGPRVRFAWQNSAPWVTASPELAERYGELFA